MILIDNIKLKRHINNMKSSNIYRQLETSVMKPNKESEETSAVDVTFICHGVKHGHSYVSQQCTTNVIKTVFSSCSTVAESMSDGALLLQSMP